MTPLIRTKIVLACLLGLVAWGAAAQDGSRLLLDDFEKSPAGWTFVDGREFPGARGSATLDQAVAHSGKASYRLEADFTGGGEYMGVWHDLASLEGRDFKEIRLWVKTSQVTELMVRIVDGTGQCHQAKVPLPPTAEKDWQRVILKVRDLVGGEHWDGASDGKWHGPARGFGLHLVKQGAKQKTLWLDDVELGLGPVVEGHPTLLSGVLTPSACRPGFGARLTFRWDAEPMGKDFTAFVHCVDAHGKMLFQADHTPAVPTSIWNGRVEYTKNLIVPTDTPDGDYRIIVGLYDPRAAKRDWDRQELKTGKGVTDVSAGPQDRAYQIGVLKVDSQAPFPQLPARTLNLDGYKLTFNEEFNDLSVSAVGPGTRWIAHTPYFGDFGDARFTDPKEGFPFTLEKGSLRIEARKTEAGWQSGLLSSVDPQGNGFSQKYGYFEMRARFPKGLGVWPAFWLMGTQGIKDKSITNPEIDVVEYYGVMPNALMMTLHLWGPADKHSAQGESYVVPGMTDDYHTYGVLVEESHMVWYFDGVELWRQKTPEEAKVPLYLMVNLAMGGGWPIDKAVSPSYMYVDYVKAYSRKP
jgi:hypothetical protein